MIETIRQVHAGMKSVPAEIAAELAEHFGDEALSDREVEVLRWKCCNCGHLGKASSLVWIV